jgi:hypothetical protein
VKQEIKQCGLCARWTDQGDDVPSGNRDPRTGETAYDNFVCRRCQREARGMNLMGRATEKFVRSRRLSRAA